MLDCVCAYALWNGMVRMDTWVARDVWMCAMRVRARACMSAWHACVLCHLCACAHALVYGARVMGTARSLTASAVAGALGLSAATCGACRATRMPLVLVFFFADFPPVPLCSGGLFALAAGLRGRALFFAGLPITSRSDGEMRACLLPSENVAVTACS